MAGLDEAGADGAEETGAEDFGATGEEDGVTTAGVLMMVVVETEVQLG